MVRVLFLTIFIAFQANAQIEGIKNRVLPKWVKNQKQLALHQIPKYLARLPKTLGECAMHYLKGSDSYRPLIFPRKWMNKNGSITLPKQKVIDRFFTAEEQKKLSNRYDNFGPGQTIK